MSTARHSRRYYKRHSTAVCARKIVARVRQYGNVPKVSTVLKHGIGVGVLVEAFADWASQARHGKLSVRTVQEKKIGLDYLRFTIKSNPDTYEEPTPGERSAIVYLRTFSD